MVTPASATLYLQKEGQTSDVATHLGGDVQMQSYDAILDAIQGLASSSTNQVFLLHQRQQNRTDDADQVILYTPTCSLALKEAAGQGKTKVIRSPITLPKAIKNKTELEGFRQSHIRDAAALVPLVCLMLSLRRCSRPR